LTLKNMSRCAEIVLME